MHTITQYIPEGETDWRSFVTVYGARLIEEERDRFEDMVAEEPYLPHRIIDGGGNVVVEYQPLIVGDTLIPQTELVSGGFVPDFSGMEGEYQLLQEWYRDNPDDHAGAVYWIRNLAAGGTIWGLLYELNGEPFTESDLLDLYQRLKVTAREGIAFYRECVGWEELKERLGNLDDCTLGWSDHGRFAAEALALGVWIVAGTMTEEWATWKPTDGE